MDKIKIVISPDADDDIRAIFDYLSDFSMNVAMSQVDRLLNKFELLRQFPRSGRVISNMNNDNLREIFVEKYRVAYYIVSETQIDILRVHHTSRPPDFE
jgi:toxin ParE1/3/4